MNARALTHTRLRARPEETGLQMRLALPGGILRSDQRTKMLRS